MVMESTVAQEPIQQPTPDVPTPTENVLPAGTVDTIPDPAVLQAEIARLETVRKEAEEKAAYWRRQKAEARADYFRGPRDQPPQAPPVAQPVLAPPVPEQFSDYNQYQDALVDYKTTIKLQEFKHEEARRANETAYQNRMAGLKERLDRGYAKYQDFGEVVVNDDTAPYTPMVIDALAEIENADDVAYYLAKNRLEAIKVSRMTPMAAAMEIKRIEMQIKQNNPTPPNLKGVVPNAPPPIKPAGSTNQVTRDPDKMSQQEFEKWREESGARRF
jgi:hypothetical protein